MMATGMRTMLGVQWRTHRRGTLDLDVRACREHGGCGSGGCGPLYDPGEDPRIRPGGQRRGRPRRNQRQGRGTSTASAGSSRTSSASSLPSSSRCSGSASSRRSPAGRRRPGGSRRSSAAGSRATSRPGRARPRLRCHLRHRRRVRDRPGCIAVFPATRSVLYAGSLGALAFVFAGLAATARSAHDALPRHLCREPARPGGGLRAARRRRCDRYLDYLAVAARLGGEGRAVRGDAVVDPAHPPRRRGLARHRCRPRRCAP